ncbi:hypothetical protein [Variovorax boronicumulans]|uniref:hypothetical protein n=1 Tax=Variovorax boronicumulans TaxID=436515 RepID=UPI001330386C|nr:hypothetical protein [Variovorax boronicumulans]
MDVLQRSEKSETGRMETKQFGKAHWSATPVEVDADVLMASLVEVMAASSVNRGGRNAGLAPMGLNQPIDVLATLRRSGGRVVTWSVSARVEPARLQGVGFIGIATRETHESDEGEAAVIKIHWLAFEAKRGAQLSDEG